MEEKGGKEKRREEERRRGAEEELKVLKIISSVRKEQSRKEVM